MISFSIGTWQIWYEKAHRIINPPIHYTPPLLPTHRHPRAREHRFRRSTSYE
jgi:hypothetical protein